MTQTEKAIKSAAREEIRAIKEKAKTDISFAKLSAYEKLASVNVKYEKKIEKKRINEENAKIPKRYSVGEEIFNSVTHGVGAGLAIAAIVLLILRSLVSPQDVRAYFVTGSAIYGGTLFILYLMSTLYHALTPYGVKKLFAVFDHSSIYLLIAGTYTPFCLGILRPSPGWWIFGVIWTLAVAGITFYAIFGSRMRRLSVITYVLMGWIIVFAFNPFRQNAPSLTVLFLILGGAFYTIGVIFYALKKIKWTHSIWHLFVLCGSILHFFSVYFAIP